jgi:hypothetical protein
LHADKVNGSRYLGLNEKSSFSIVGKVSSMFSVILTMIMNSAGIINKLFLFPYTSKLYLLLSDQPDKIEDIFIKGICQYWVRYLSHFDKFKRI